jgi:uncharacterized protein
MDIIKKIAEELEVGNGQVEAAVKLIDEGCTIPFIARYRKEATGALNDEQLRVLGSRLTTLRNLEEKKEKIREAIETQGKLTPELAKQIEAAETSVALDDIYRPYRPKRTTRATIAAEKGLTGLANIIWAQKTDKTLEEEAQAFISEEKGVLTAEEAIQGACDILAERFSDSPAVRSYIRGVTEKRGILQSEAKDKDEKSVYETYYDFSEPVSKVSGYRVLAINRGEKEKLLKVGIEAPEDEILNFLKSRLIKKGNPRTGDAMGRAIEDSYARLIAPSIEREVRNELTEKAEDGAIQVFRKNLHQLLMQPPIAGETVLGWDPAFRTGCKLAVVDATGKVLDTAVIFPTAPTSEAKQRAAAAKIKELVKKYHVTLISVGNGTASRESEQFLAEVLREIPEKVYYVITNEAGASVYSASALATEEFPEFDVGQRSAASIARRVQDPLAELVKIDPKSIGVGQYQHDMDQKKLGEALGGVVEDCVNAVGVDLNTASAPLLQYISGITKATAKNIVAYREENGRFDSRRELLKVPKLGPKAFEQCAGFLRISGGKEPLDNTGVHPESYPLAKALLKAAGIEETEIGHGPIALYIGRNSVSEKNTDGGNGTAGGKDRASGGKGVSGKVGASGKEATSGKEGASGKEGVSGKEGASGKNGGTEACNELVSKLMEEFGVGEITIQSVVKELTGAGRDPREDMPQPILKSDVMTMEDLKPGMLLKGTVRNVIDFGAFVDIGVHQDGLVHISRMSKKYVKHPLDVVSVGDVVEVKVVDVDLAKKRISLSMLVDE